MTVEQPIDEMKIAGPAASGTYSKLSCDVRLGAGGKGCHFLVPCVDPFNRLLAPHRVEYAVERVADDSVNPFHSGMGQSLHQDFRNGSHDSSGSIPSRALMLAARASVSVF